MVIRFRGVRLEARRHKRSALHESDGCEIDAIGDVPHSPNAVHSSATELIHLDSSIFVQLHPHLFQAEVRAIGVRGSARGKHHNIAFHDRLPRVQREGQLAARHLLDLDGVCARMHMHPALGQVLTHRVAHILVEAAEGGRLAVHDVGLRPGGVEDAREFHRNEPASKHDHFLGDLVNNERLVGGDAELRTGDVQLVGCAPRGDQNVGRGHVAHGAVGRRYLHGVVIQELAGADDASHFGIGEHRAIDAVEARNL
mmetsp:Transcript_10926/g.18704  ORF Transcript_10926/g.18704 Transcript_10926/m.18704 type:complete len:255 (+) Transcript_10926:462-1226(+)